MSLSRTLRSLPVLRLTTPLRSGSGPAEPQDVARVEKLAGGPAPSGEKPVGGRRVDPGTESSASAPTAGGNPAWGPASGPATRRA